jgi:hypothetical protein
MSQQPSPNLAFAAGTQGTATLELDGERFEIRPCTMRTLGKLQDWLVKAGPPRALAAARVETEGLDPGLAGPILQDAALIDRSWPPQFLFNPGAALPAMIERPDGGDVLAFHVLKQARPDLADARLVDLAGELDGLAFNRLVAAAFSTRSELEVDPGRAEVALVDRGGLLRLARYVAACLGVEPAPGQLEPVVAAVPLDAIGSVVALRVDRDGGPEVDPKAPLPEPPPVAASSTARAGRGKAPSARSTSPPPTP